MAGAEGSDPRQQWAVVSETGEAKLLSIPSQYIALSDKYKVQCEDLERMEAQIAGQNVTNDSLLHQLAIQDRRIEDLNKENKDTKDELARLKDEFARIKENVSASGQEEHLVYGYCKGEKFHRIDDKCCKYVSTLSKTPAQLREMSVPRMYAIKLREPCKLCYPTLTDVWHDEEGCTQVHAIGS